AAGSKIERRGDMGDRHRHGALQPVTSRAVARRAGKWGRHEPLASDHLDSSAAGGYRLRGGPEDDGLLAWVSTVVWRHGAVFWQHLLAFEAFGEKSEDWRLASSDEPAG